jgi:hypothetical protein
LQKRPAVQSSPNPSSYNRDQSEIATSWWAKKKEKLSVLQRQVSRLKARVHALEVQAQVSNEKIEELTVALQAAQCPEVDPNVQKVVDTINNNDGFKKIDSKDGSVIAISALLTSFLAIIMRNTHPITRLHTVTDVLFNKMIFGAEITGTVLQEIYEKYIIPKQHRIFLPWKILRAIDLTIAGGLNYNGVEALHSVEELGRYERGILSSRSQIQRASYMSYISLGKSHTF